MRIGVDLDGVLYDFHGALRRYLTGCGWPHPMPDPCRWNFYHDWGFENVDAFTEACHHGVDAGIVFRTGTPAPGSHEALCRLRTAGHTLHAVTARDYGAPGRAATSTFAWLADTLCFDFDSVTFSGDKTIVGCDWFVEDNTRNYDQLAAAGVNAVLVNQPWNRTNGNAPDDGYVRVPDISRFADLVDAS